ncbi:unnamed protein product, partial [Didymodactylos carnosus]
MASPLMESRIRYLNALKYTPNETINAGYESALKEFPR